MDETEGGGGVDSREKKRLGARRTGGQSLAALSCEIEVKYPHFTDKATDTIPGGMSHARKEPALEPTGHGPPSFMG